MSSKIASKAIKFTAQATESHTAIKIKNVIKWLKKGHEVQVQILGTPDKQKSMESIYKDLERSVKPGADVLQKNFKPDIIRFTLRPRQDHSSEEIESSSNKH